MEADAAAGGARPRALREGASVQALGLALLLAAAAPAQPLPERAHSFGVADGLPSPTVTALAQDEVGFLWAGTVDGLAVFDGDTFTDVLPLADLSARYVNAGAIEPVARGGLWVGTEGGALFRSGRTGRVHVVRDGLPSPDVLSVLADGDRVWLGTSSGLAVTDAPTSAPRTWPGDLPHPVVRALARGADGALWVGTLDGACRITPGEPDCRPLSLEPEHRRVQALEPDGPRTWIGTSAGGLLLASSSGRVLASHAIGAPVVAIAADGDGGVWAATYGAGLVHVASDGRRHLVYGSGLDGGSDYVVDVAVDGTGGVWVASGRGAELLVAGVPYEFVRGLPSPDVTALVPYGRGLAVATAGGVVRVESATGRAQPWANLRNVTALAVDGPRLWAATAAAGVQELSSNGTATPLPVAPPPGADLQRVYDVAVTDGAVWVASMTTGVCRVSGGRARCWDRSSPTTADRASALCSAPDGSVLAGRFGGGLVRFVRTGDEYAPRRVSSVPGDARVVGLGCDPDLFVGLVDGALVASGSFSAALPHPTATCAVRDQRGRTWVATLRGLAVIEPDGSVRPVPELPALEYRPGACARVGDHIYLGSNQGLLRFRPDDVPPPSFGPVVITGIDGADSGGLTPAYARQATVTSPTSAVEVSFAMLHFGAMNRRLQYRLRGVGDDWTEAGALRRARFPGLRPGRYRFEVRAVAAPHLAAALDLRVPVPLWRRPWVLILLGATGMAVAFATVRFRTLARERVEQTRRQIADDLHDDLGSRLGGLATALDVTSRTVPAAVSDEVRSRADEAREILGDLRDTVWIVDGAEGSLRSLVERARLAAERLLPGVQLSTETTGNLDRPLDIQRRRHLLLFCKEALHNAARHGGPQYVHLSVVVAPDDHVSVSIRDNGRGFDTAGGGRGMGTLQRRADALRGHLDIVSAPAEGTRVHLSFRL